MIVLSNLINPYMEIHLPNMANSLITYLLGPSRPTPRASQLPKIPTHGLFSQFGHLHDATTAAMGISEKENKQ